MLGEPISHGCSVEIRQSTIQMDGEIINIRVYIYVISYINIHTLLTTAYVLEGICTDCADYFYMNIIVSGLKYRSLRELLYNMKHTYT